MSKIKQSENTKTIVMTKTQRDLWTAALRSGKYTQGSCALYQRPLVRENTADGTAKYCCLGVLQRVLTGRNPKLSQQLPSASFLKKYGIMFNQTRDPMLPSLKDNDNLSMSAAQANDAAISFKEIARAIVLATKIIPE